MRTLPELSTELGENVKFRFAQYFQYGFEMWKRHFFLLASYIAICLFLRFIFWEAFNLFSFFKDLKQLIGSQYFPLFSFFIQSISLSIFTGGFHSKLLEVHIYERKQHWLSDFLPTDTDMALFLYLGMVNFGVISFLTNLPYFLTDLNTPEYYLLFQITSVLCCVWLSFCLFSLPIIVVYEVSWYEALTASFAIVKQKVLYFIGFYLILNLLTNLFFAVEYELELYYGLGRIALQTGTYGYYVLTFFWYIYQILSYSFVGCVVFACFEHLVLKISPSTGMEEEIEETLEDKINKIGRED